MCKEYRVDGFYSGHHSKQYFDTREQAERFAKKRSCAGEIMFLLKRMSGSNLYDIVTIIQ